MALAGLWLAGILLSIHLLSNIAVQLAFIAFATVFGYFGVKWYLKKRHQRKVLAVDFMEIDAMAGHSFEHYIADLLRLRGYDTRVTRGSGDNGVDVIAVRDGVSWAIQCKRLASKADRRAISDAVSATSSVMFNCNKAMVVTNSYFTKAAIEYARSTDCLLIDRDQLSKWILEVRSLRALAGPIPQIDNQTTCDDLTHT